MYGKQDLVDYDVLSPDFNEHATEIARILIYEGRRVAIKTGMTGKTRKIFVDIAPDAIIDITLIEEDEYEMYDLVEDPTEVNNLVNNSSMETTKQELHELRKKTVAERIGVKDFDSAVESWNQFG